MKKNELQQLADDRIADAQALLDAKRWSAAYYLAGYATECALKACVLSYVEKNSDVIFREKKYSENCWTHKIDTLLELADLKALRDQENAANPPFGPNWQTARDWQPESRYDQISESEARKLFEAITDSTYGVLPWIKAHW